MASGDEIWSLVAARRTLQSGERKGKKLARETWSSETWQCYCVIIRLRKYEALHGSLCFVKFRDRYVDCIIKSFLSLESNFHMFRNTNLLRIMTSLQNKECYPPTCRESFAIFLL